MHVVAENSYDLKRIQLDVDSIVNKWYQLTRGLCSLFLFLRYISVHSFTVADSLNRALHMNAFAMDATLDSASIEEMRPREVFTLSFLVKSVF